MLGSEWARSLGVKRVIPNAEVFSAGLATKSMARATFASTYIRQTLLEIAPEGNSQLARHCNDHDAFNAPALVGGALRKPSGDFALGLMLDP